MISRIRNLLAFLTVIPVGMDANYLRDSADLMYLFPLVGGFIGLLAGLLALVLERLFPASLVGALSLGFILLVTGLHHTDGLLDLGDGLMRTGSPEKKIEAMHDVRKGTGALVLGIMTILITVAAIGLVRPQRLFLSLVVSETLAKFSMTLEASVGRSAHAGMNSLFIDAMHGRWRGLRLGLAFAVSAGVSFLLPNLSGLVSLAAVVLTSFVMVSISNRHFKGLTGDVFGATNDLARMVSLLAVVATA